MVMAGVARTVRGPSMVPLLHFSCMSLCWLFSFQTTSYGVTAERRRARTSALVSISSAVKKSWYTHGTLCLPADCREPEIKQQESYAQAIIYLSIQNCIVFVEQACHRFIEHVSCWPHVDTDVQLTPLLHDRVVWILSPLHSPSTTCTGCVHLPVQLSSKTARGAQWNREAAANLISAKRTGIQRFSQPRRCSARICCEATGQ